MKKYLVVVGLVVFGFGAFGQMKDSIPSVQKQIDDIYMRMDKHHTQFRNGTYAIIVGYIVAGVSTSMILTNDGNSDVSGAKIGLFVGSGLVSIGTAIQINSHKYFDRKRKVIY